MNLAKGRRGSDQVDCGLIKRPCAGLLFLQYSKIIGLGLAAVPLILDELQQQPDHWFWALEAITGENPVSKDDVGDIEASTSAWIHWGRENGYLKQFVTSPRTIRYNCIAWAARNTDRWWQPGVFWPIEAAGGDVAIGNLIELFKSLGYDECDDGGLEVGFEKIAIYGAGLMYTHAARQLPDGMWTSKIGQLEDITHSTTEAIEGSDYGYVVQFMKRSSVETP